jgi:Glutathione-dependent formaldehyde-activating enzyme
MAATFRPLLSLPQLSAADRQRVCDQRADRERPRRIARGRARARAGSPFRAKRQQIYRCPVCKTAVWSTYTRKNVLFVRVGTLDDPSAVEPDVHIFTRSKVPWLTLPESTPAFTTYYDTQKLWPTASLERLEALRSR